MDPLSVVREYFAAWNAADEARLEAILAPDVHASGPIRTVEGGTEHAASLAHSAQAFHEITVERMMADGPDVLTWFTFHTTTGVAMPAANWCRVEGGRVQQVRATFDPRPLLSR